MAKETKQKAEQQKRVLDFKDFDLVKCKLTKNGTQIGLYVEHYERGDDDKGLLTCDGKGNPDPDFYKAINQLKLYMAERLGLIEGWNFSRDALKKQPEELEKAKFGHDAAVQRCNINGLKFSGDGETYGVIITGSIHLPEGGTVGLALPKIKFGENKLGYEQEIEELCDDIRKEVYAYRFQHKREQLDLETEIAKQEHPELFEDATKNAAKNKASNMEVI